MGYAFLDKQPHVPYLVGRLALQPPVLSKQRQWTAFDQHWRQVFRWLDLLLDPDCIIVVDGQLKLGSYKDQIQEWLSRQLDPAAASI